MVLLIAGHRNSLFFGIRQDPRDREGPPGPEGPQGPPGPPPILWTARQSTPVNLTDTGGPVQVLTLNVPAGTYAISGKVSVANLDSASAPLPVC